MVLLYNKNVKEDDAMSAYVKPIQATPTLSGNDAVSIVKQVLKAPSQQAGGVGWDAVVPVSGHLAGTLCGMVRRGIPNPYQTWSCSRPLRAELEGNAALFSLPAPVVRGSAAAGPSA